MLTLRHNIASLRLHQPSSGILAAATVARVTRRINFSFLSIGCLAVVFVLETAAIAQLPSESVLPGSQRPAKLPSEVELPGQAPAVTELPGEDQIPAASNDGPRVGVEAAIEEASAPIAGKAPILRLAFDGHTGIIRTLDLSDGGRTLISAGEDKEVHVWRRSDLGDTGWIHRRTIRWPVTRGPRGRIYTSRLKGDLAAFAGHGAFTSLGEIRIVDVASGDIQQTLVRNRDSHRAVILSLDWSPAQPMRLASLDMEGRLMTWQPDPLTGLWNGRTVFVGDVNYDAQYGVPIAAALKPYREFGAIRFAGPNHLVMPLYVGQAAEPKGAANWKLYRLDLRTNQWEPLKEVDHIYYVRALDATEDGRVLASCGGFANVGLWKFNADGTTASARTIKVASPPLSLDLSSNGKRMLVGTQIPDPDLKPGPSRLQLWDTGADPPRMLSEQIMADHVHAVVIDGQRNEAIVTQGTDVLVYSIDEQGQLSSDPKRLTVPAKAVRRVAFSKQDYQIGIGWRAGEAGVPWERIFDLQESRLLGRRRVNEDNFVDPQPAAARWQVREVSSNVGVRYQLLEGDTPRATLPLIPNLHGEVTALCTLPVLPAGNEDPAQRRPAGAVIVGTTGGNNIYAFAANDADPPLLLRQFRDHSGGITSLSTSADGNYLVSGSLDAMISVWNLQDIFTASRSVNRWGAEFDVEDQHLIASDVREDGPLFFRGVRSGDRLTVIQWADEQGNIDAESDPEQMRLRLLDSPFDRLIEFKFARLGRLGPNFVSYPAWRPLATLFVDDSREWAFWTPAGYYDASFNGHQRFGWQLNNARDQEVDFFRAAQFRRRLERGDIMRRLLAAGSLPAAMRQTVSQIGPPPAEDAIVNQIESRPKIRLISPQAGEVIEGTRLTVRAEITVPRGATLVEPKAFVSGVPAVDRRQLPRGGGENVVSYQWQFRLPSDPRLQLEILAATESEAVDRALMDLERKPPEKSEIKPRLHVLAIGAGRYRDPQITSLDFAARAAETVSQLFREMSSSIYRTSSDRLVDTDATRPMWRVFAQTAAQQLSETVSPDDLVVMYLCGHGVRDRRTNQWYFVTSDASYSDIMNDQYDDCIAFSDLAVLSRLPCRKLAIVDSCHSGAVQPLMQRDDLKSALRFLQDDVVLTITASEGDEEAAEQRETQLGRFTTALVSALGGQAREFDGDPDSVSLAETIQYVTDRVTRESEQDQLPQHPTASPSYLLRTLRLPLTKRPRNPPGFLD